MLLCRVCDALAKRGAVRGTVDLDIVLRLSMKDFEIEMKKKSGRPQDLADIQALEALK